MLKRHSSNCKKGNHTKVMLSNKKVYCIHCGKKLTFLKKIAN